MFRCRGPRSNEKFGMLELYDAGSLDQEVLVPEVTLVLATAKRKNLLA